MNHRLSKGRSATEGTAGGKGVRQNPQRSETLQFFCKNNLILRLF